MKGDKYWSMCSQAIRYMSWLVQEKDIYPNELDVRIGEEDVSIYYEGRLLTNITPDGQLLLSFMEKNPYPGNLKQKPMELIRAMENQRGSEL